MRAVVIDRPGRWDVRTVLDPTPSPGELVLRVDHAGICGTDVHVVDGAFPAARYPLIPGHELAGTVVALGPGVTGWRVGEQVVVDPSFQCGTCVHCRAGQDNLCVDFGGSGLTRDGGAAELAVVDARKAYPAPAGVPAHWLPLAEPLACALRGMDRLPRTPGASYLVYGAGTMGLLLAQLARRAGGSRVDLVEVNSARLPEAIRIAADRAAISADEFNEPGWDVVIDATGAKSAIEDALRRVQRGGTFLQFGVAPQLATVPLSPARVATDELTIVGAMGIRGTFGRALALLARGDVVDAEAMISHRFPLEEYGAALAAVRDGVGIKVQVAPHAGPIAVRAAL